MPFAELLDPSAGRRVRGVQVVALPGAQVTSLRVDVPEQIKASAARTIALGAAQDWAASASADVTCAVLPGTGASRTVLIVDSATLADWAETIADRGLRNMALLPDYLCLPWTPGDISVSTMPNDMVAVRVSETEGFTAPAALAATMLNRALATTPAAGAVAPKRVRCTGNDATHAALFADLSLPTEPWPEDATPNVPDGSLLAHQRWTAALSGGMAWPRLAALAACAACAAVWSVTTWQATTAQERQIAGLRAQTLDIARNHFAIAGPILDLRRQVERQITAPQGSTDAASARLDFDDLLVRAAPVLAANNVTLTALTYQQNTLSSAFIASGFSDLETIVAELRGASLSVDVEQSVLDGDAGVRARLRLSADIGGQ